jgi:hypothetical protein
MCGFIEADLDDRFVVVAFEFIVLIPAFVKNA